MTDVLTIVRILLYLQILLEHSQDWARKLAQILVLFFILEGTGNGEQAKGNKNSRNSFSRIAISTINYQF